VSVASIRSAALVALMLAATVACGHKGNPVPPEHPEPPAVSGFAIERTGADVTLRFTVPDPQSDDHAARLFERVEVYALTRSATDPAPMSIELLVSAHQVATVRPPVTPKAGGDEAPAKSSDAMMVFKDTAPPGAPDQKRLRYYAVQAANGKRRGPLSPILKVSLDVTPPVPANVVTKYDERALTVSWSAGGTGQRFVVDETDATGGSPRRLTPAPIDAPAFEVPIEFGKPRCFVVRGIQSAFDVSIIGEPAAPVCVTPADRFPPAAPTDLIASAGDTSIDLAWTASAAADVAGYIILRAEGANGTLQPLTPQPVTATAYQDATARSGVTYLYAVKAVDRAGNESALSNRYPVTARAAAAGVVRRGRGER